jgi:hypothetical protein
MGGVTAAGLKGILYFMMTCKLSQPKFSTLVSSVRVSKRLVWLVAFQRSVWIICTRRDI